MESKNLEDVASRTLELLEWRLKRLEFLLTGEATPNDESSQSTDHASIPVTKRIHKLEQSLHKLASKSDTISSLIKLRTCTSPLSGLQLTAPESQSPSIFKPTTPTNPSIPSMPLPAKAATILSHAPLYQSTASQLRALNDTRSIPPTSSFAELVALAPRIHEAAQKQSEQAEELAELRKRTAAVAVRWQEVFVVAQGRCWVEWEGRVRGVEREVNMERRRVQREEEG
jgi:hypothetical protein